MKIKTSELTGAALDWAVAICEGYTDLRRNCHAFNNALLMTPPRSDYGSVELYDLNYSSDWDLGGPIIEREGIAILRRGPWVNPVQAAIWVAEITHPPSLTSRNALQKDVCKSGPTPLIAAMRAFVASRLGDEVEIPEELL